MPSAQAMDNLDIEQRDESMTLLSEPSKGLSAIRDLKAKKRNQALLKQIPTPPG